MADRTVGEDRPSTPLLERLASGQVALRRNADVDYILDLALDEGLRMARAQVGNFYFFDEHGELVPFHTGAGADDAESRDLCLYCIRNHVSLNLAPDSEGSEAHEGGDPTPPEDAVDIRVSTPTICVYLGLQEGDFGAIILRSPRVFRRFYENDVSLIKTFATTFSILLKNSWRDRTSSEIFLSFKSSLLLLLENANLIQKLKQSDHTLHSVLEVSNLINSSRELREMIQAVLYSARKIIVAESASLFLMDENTGELYFDIISGDESEGLQGMRIPQGQGIVGICAQEKRSILVNDAQNDPRLYKKVDEVSRTITRNLMAAPLLVEDRTIGVIEVINTVDRSTFSERDLQVFESFSDSVAIALQRRQIQDDLQSTNIKLEQRLSEILCLHAVSGALVEATSVAEIFDRVLTIIRESLDVGRVSVLIKDEGDGHLHVTARKPDAGGAEDVADGMEEVEQREERLSERVFALNRPVFIEDFEHSEFAHLARPDRYSTRSCILIPLASSKESKPFGVLCATESAMGRFREDDYRLLITIASQMVRGIDNVRLSEEILAKQAIEKEVEITSKIQQDILPKSKPAHKHVELSARSVMARMTGGDFYDYHVDGPEADATFLVADVSGKSLPAALFMAISSSILRTIIRSEVDPTRVLGRANELIFEESESGMFVTVFLARYVAGERLLRFASAGHNEMVLLHVDGTYEILSGKGPPLGVVGSPSRYEGGTTELREGDLLILYTDGVVEAVNEQNEEFGLPRFLDLIRKNRTRSPEEMINVVYDEVTEYSGSELQFDDFTMLVTRFRGIQPDLNRYHISMPARTESIPILRDFIMHICMRHSVRGNTLEDLLLVADEAATNIVLHAYENVETNDPSFECDLEVEEDRFVRLVFRDRGGLFNVKAVKHPDLRANLAGERKGGFGVYLIKRLMDEVSYLRQDEVNYLFAEKRLRR